MTEDFDFSDLNAGHFVQEIDAQILEMKARLEAMVAKRRPVEAQSLLRFRIGVMGKLRDFLSGAEIALPAEAEPEPEALSDDWED